MNTLKGLQQKIDLNQASVAVIGLGYAGLPVAIEFAKTGCRVTGIDKSPEKIKNLQSGTSDVSDISDEDLGKVINRVFTVTSDYTALHDVDVIIICVPTPLSKTKDPDLSFVMSAVESLGPFLHAGQLIVLESTTYPGTTDELILPELEKSGLIVGQDISLAFSPERIDPGNKQFTVRQIPKVVGGITPICCDLTVKLYSRIVDKVIPVSTTRTAEMVKLLENTFRSVNIGLVNEIALICDKLEIDVWETIDAASSKPFGFIPFYPGPGLGGHCIPIDPHYLSWKLKTLNYAARFIALASEVNSNMPHYATSKITDALNNNRKSVNGSDVLVIGVSYKADIKDTRESPAIDIIELLEGKGAHVSYHDPYVPDLSINERLYHSMVLTADAISKYDCVAIITNHSSLDIPFIVEHAQAVVDTRNATKHIVAHRDKIIKI